ncbi:hypothetical protein HanHA300_Chr06g0222971 [Helianthus annuus]|nr:hypothetical protein HanHA300_Chr06g0222971 [Helianthus annuus]KAJ0574505.1 hypothetical protein HanHA89_Chr06g0238881 [Helianthus annuus]KAJ0738835.1 hypothetical protein HanLR1_Chr06g0222771 [Helianthus annuus]KAJ0741712.1 hypothetical protein HanOQP8_Chr06g0231141 [Helianthus annuus]
MQVAHPLLLLLLHCLLQFAHPLLMQVFKFMTSLPFPLRDNQGGAVDNPWMLIAVVPET